jgi:hypothetical protein
MTVIRYEPWALGSRLQKDIDRLLSDRRPLPPIPARGCRRSTFMRKRISSW